MSQILGQVEPDKILFDRKTQKPKGHAPNEVFNEAFVC